MGPSDGKLAWNARYSHTRGQQREYVDAARERNGGLAKQMDIECPPLPPVGYLADIYGRPHETSGRLGEKGCGCIRRDGATGLVSAERQS